MPAQSDLRGRVAIVTNATSDIGRAAALALARNGAAVIVNYLNDERSATETVIEIQRLRRNALAVRADITKRPEIVAMVAETLENFERIDILINNTVSSESLTKLEDCTEEIWDTVLATNLKSIFLCSQVIAPHFKRQRSGRIINISPLAFEVYGANESLPYAVAKGAVDTLTKSLARELASFKVTVNTIRPRSIEAPFHENPERPAKNASHTLSPHSEGVAELAAFLASDEANSITGEIINIA